RPSRGPDHPDPQRAHPRGLPRRAPERDEVGPYRQEPAGPRQRRIEPARPEPAGKREDEGDRRDRNEVPELRKSGVEHEAGAPRGEAAEPCRLDWRFPVEQPPCPGFHELVERPRASAESYGDLFAETGCLARQRGANLRQQEHLLERTPERGARHEALREFLGRQLGGDPLEHLVFGERAAERLRERPGEQRVERPLGRLLRQAIEPHELSSSLRRILGVTAQSRRPEPGAISPSTSTAATPPFLSWNRKQCSLPAQRSEASVEKYGSWPESATDCSFSSRRTASAPEAGFPASRAGQSRGDGQRATSCSSSAVAHARANPLESTTSTSGTSRRRPAAAERNLRIPSSVNGRAESSGHLAASAWPA